MVRFRSHEVHNTHGTSVIGVDNSGGSFLAPMPSVDLKVSQVTYQISVQSMNVAFMVAQCSTLY